MTAPIAISLNFDSLNEAYGFPSGFRDPSFFEFFDRFAELAARYEFPISIYIIARDLEHPEHFARVRDWATAGFEIGNHSWSHPFNLGGMPKDRMREEICRAHDAIASCTRTEPTGFIAPAWSTSREVVSTLIDLGYQYDTSVFPSVYLYPFVLKAAVNHLGNSKKLWSLFQRGDWTVPFSKPVRPYVVDRQFREVRNPAETTERLVILPLPTRSHLAPCIWHTVGFVFGRDYLARQLHRLLDTHTGFYYLIHPADFIGQEDVRAWGRQHLQRMQFSLRQKMESLTDVFELLRCCGRPVRLMADLARYHMDQLGETTAPR